VVTAIRSVFKKVTVHNAADLDIRALLDKQQYHDPDGLAEAAGISLPTSRPAKVGCT
jgi:hypothetical protein